MATTSTILSAVRAAWKLYLAHGQTEVPAIILDVPLAESVTS